MRLQTGGNGDIDFNYHLLKDAYVVNLTIQANGMANFFPSSQKSINMDWRQRFRHLEKGYSFEQRYTALTYKRTQDNDSKNLSETRDANKEVSDALDWIAFKGQFFSTVWIANQEFNNASLVSKMEEKESNYMKSYAANMTAFFDPTAYRDSDFHGSEPLQDLEGNKRAGYIRQEIATAQDGLSGMAYRPLDQPLVYHSFVRLVVGLGLEHGLGSIADDPDRQGFGLSGYLQVIHLFC